ncbi:MAG TPA: CheR family methyltransferase [Sporichthyaceae bacterium]
MARVPLTEPDPAFEALLAYLKESRGFDFTGYKRTSLMRRVQRRVTEVGCTGFVDYLDHLQVHPEEFTVLFNTILINVTGFFRDAEAWSHLRKEIIPALLQAKPADRPVRVWSAGCASGEEAYSLAIALAEEMGVDEYRARVKIYATDVDEDALAAARQATYDTALTRGLDAEILERYFEPVGQRYAFRKDLRRSVIFGRNDLVQDAPISRIDLLVCRNTLMYFTAEAQARILGRFNFALAPGGVLFLGRAEMLLSHSGLFAPIDLKRRVFRKATARDRAVDGAAASPASADPPRSELDRMDRLRESSLLTSPMPQIVVTPDGLVALVNRAADNVFGMSHRDVGRPLRDMEQAFRPLDLRGYVEQAQLQRRTVRIPNVEWVRDPAGPLSFDVQVTPLGDGDGGLLGISLVFLDVTEARRLQKEVEAANRQLEAAYEELQSTNEELETTNEELQSTVEELETTNEELQSTNEELETMNEELQSANDELQTINDEFNVRTGELDELNYFFDSILGGLRSGVVVVDHDLRVLVWNRASEDMWGLRRDEVVGRHALDLDIGLPVERLRADVRGVLADGKQRGQELPAVDRRGREVRARVTCTPLRGPAADPRGVILVVETDELSRVEPAID